MPQPMPFPTPDGHRPSPRPTPHPAAPAPVRSENGWGGGWDSLTADEPTERAVRTAPGGDGGHAVRAEPEAEVATPRPSGRRAARSAEEDSSGRGLAMRLPEWDLLPPTEFVQRRRGR